MSPTSSQDDARFTRIEQKLDKYDEIISDLRTIVVALKTRADTNQRWITIMLTVGATLVGAIIGALATHWHP